MAGREKRKRRRKSRLERRPARPPAEAADQTRSKDDLARDELVPLREGERPRAVTVAAIVAGLLGASNLIGLLAGVEIGGEKPGAGAVLPPAALMLVAAFGMWRARYWAVLGFQTILAFLVVFMSLLLVRAENLLAVVVALSIIAGAGTLFWFLVKSLARLQMPDRRPSSG